MMLSRMLYTTTLIKQMTHIPSSKVSNHRFDREPINLKLYDYYQRAEEKVEEGLIIEAIQLLKDELLYNPEHSEAWCLLGRLYIKSNANMAEIYEMKMGLVVNPFNSELIMCLGIIYADKFYDDNDIRRYILHSISHEDESLNYFKTWIQLKNPNPEISFRLSLNNREDILEAYKDAASSNSNNPDFLQAIGLLYRFSNDFDMAEQYFRKALMIIKHDAAIWNRLGELLHVQYRIEEAFECYNNALQIESGFVRTWVNMGNAYGTLGDTESSARFYLCAWSLNPSLNYLIEYLKPKFILMRRDDLLNKLKQRDPRLFISEFDMITVETLPKGSICTDDFLV